MVLDYVEDKSDRPQTYKVVAGYAVTSHSSFAENMKINKLLVLTQMYWKSSLQIEQNVCIRYRIYERRKTSSL